MKRYPVEDAFNFEDVANDILQMANDLIGKHEFFVSFIDEKILKVLKVKNKIWLDEGIIMPIEETYCQYTLQGKEPVLIVNSLVDERVKFLNATITNKMCSYAGVPIILKNGIVFGTVCAQNKEPFLFDQKTINILTRLAKFLSYVVDLETFIIKDSLTGLYNRYFWNKMIAQLNSNHTVHTFLMFDIDKFKKINDQFGHEKGDEVLIRVGEILQNSIPNNAYAFRFGGDEFGVLFTDSSVEETADTVNELIAKCEEIRLDQNTIVNISCGIVDTNKVDISKLMAVADQCLYFSKKESKSFVTQA
ncbi:sensor domain-containing diguanylate cyclase [Gottfriedia solisilvae]|uniref:GGDEF domain-containing protein n=1 Tax=Gottfriedia solisilvae TaxID=1516104 RepID=A0A8J3AQX2_9BACI|nr:sensor domain-containing diguanylate cyclase [Gottfriedia solisilvae]GGI15272.1 hypothetical protein GCM10007380_27140 [Gottfriedia solisilvae]